MILVYFSAIIFPSTTITVIYKLIYKVLKRNLKNLFVNTIRRILTTNIGNYYFIYVISSFSNIFFRDTLKRNYNLGQYYLEVNIEDVGSFDENLADKLYKQPSEHLPIFEEAATEVVDELTAPRPEGEENVEDIQIMLSSDAHGSDLRSLKVI